MTARYDDRSSRAYENTHGHRPRGFGFWMFLLTWDGGRSEDHFEMTGTFSETKAAAMRHARSFKVADVTVGVLP